MTPATSWGGWVDTHCHVHDEAIVEGADAAIAAAVAAGVTTMITVGCDRATSLAALDVATRHPEVHATVGLHPHEARYGVGSIADLFDTPDGESGGVRPVAVGECGLDYYYDHSPRDAQREAFAAQISLAHEHGLPLVIHTRDAWHDTFDVLAAQDVPERVIFHCFTGGPDEATQALALGAFLSFSGIITFKGASDVRAAAAMCPIERTLVETDSPYLAPVPHRGQPNRPAWVPLVGACLGEIHRQPVDQIRFSTAVAARLAFPGLPPSSTPN